VRRAPLARLPGQPGAGGPRARLLLWSSLSFIGLACNNLLLFVDLVVVPSIDLSLYRSLMSAVSVMVLLLGLIWDSN
jgi:hypothetical protein